MPSTFLTAAEPYLFAVGPAWILFTAWSFWNARIRKISLTSINPNRLNEALGNQPPRIRSEILARGWLTNSDWMALERKVISQPPKAPPGMVAIEPLHRDFLGEPRPFDSGVLMKNDAGEEIRFLINQLSSSYIVQPGEYCREGMLPPVEFHIRALCFEVLMANLKVQQVSFMAKHFWCKDEFAARVQILVSCANDLLSLVSSSDEGRAAFRRILSTYPGGPPGFLHVFAEAVEEK